MKTRYSFVLAGLALAFVFATPVLAQDVAKEEGEAAHAEMMASHNEMMSEGEGCQCACMKEMHEKMMKMHGDAEGAEGMDHGEGEGHAGMEEDGDHAEMMASHQAMMADCECAADCKCMSGEMGEGEHAMSCQMHGQAGAMGEKGEGMQHRHGMESDEDSESETEEEG